MTVHDTPTTLSRVQQQIDMIKNAETDQQSQVSRHIATGYLLALFFEKLIDNEEHTQLEAAVDLARRQWVPPAERETYD
jgi:hypothetical protein